MNKFIAELKERRLGKTLILYLGSGWVVIEALNFFIDKFELGKSLFNVVLILALCGLPVALLIAWFHGKPGNQKITKTEIFLQAIILAVATTLVAWVTLTSHDKTYRSSTSGANSIAVLPFQNVSKDPDNEFISDGITGDIIAKLSQLSEFKVISRTSSFYYKGNPKTVPEIGKELRVSNILEGTVRRSGNQLRITAELVDVMSDESIWVETFDRNITELFAIQSEVAERITKALRLKLSPDERQRIGKTPDFNLESYEHYQKGLGLLRGGGSQEELDQAVTEFNQAIALNLKFSSAYIGLANTYLDYEGWGRKSLSEVVPKARAAALKAIELNENVGEAYDILAACALNYDWDPNKFLEYIQKAISLAPNFDRAYDRYATYYSIQQDTTNALKYMRRAFELNPMSNRYLVAPAFCYSFTRNNDRAIKYSNALLKKYPDDNLVLFSLGQAYSVAGNYDKAIETFHRRTAGTYTNWCLGFAYGKAGRKEEAEKVLNYLIEKSKNQFVPPIMIGYVYLGLGEKEKALDYFEQLSDKTAGFDWIALILGDSRLDEIRQNPRFVKLRKTIPF